MKSGFTRTNLKFSRVSSNAWRGTVAAQTNEQCLSNMQDTLGAGSSSDKELCVKVLYRSCFQAQACELLPSILHKIQDSIWFKRRHHVSVCAAQLSHWQGTVAAQTNEQCLFNMQPRERILFEKPGSSVTNLFSSLQDKKSQPSQTITNYPKFCSTKAGHDRSDKYEHCQNTPKESETETIWNSETMQWLPELRCGKASWTSQSLTSQRRKWLTCPIWRHFLVKQTWFVYESENRIVRIVQWSCFTYREFDWLLQLWF